MATNYRLNGLKKLILLRGLPFGAVGNSSSFTHLIPTLPIPPLPLFCLKAQPLINIHALLFCIQYAKTYFI